MVPNGVLRQPLGVFLAEDLLMSGEFPWYSRDQFGWDGPWMQQHFSNKVGGGPFRPGDIPLSWNELSPLCVVCPEDNG
jgi:hypothetical protein